MKQTAKIFCLALAALMLTACGSAEGTASESKPTPTASDTAELKACDICGKLIPTADGISTPLCEFVCPDCVAAGAGGTTPPPMTDSPAESTSQSVDEILPKTCVALDGTAEIIDMTRLTGFYGNVYYEAQEPYAIMRRSSGEFDTSAESPELYDFDNITAPYDYKLGELFRVSAGDVFGPLTVSKAQTKFSASELDDGHWFSHEVIFDGTVTLDGYLIYYTYDEYGVSVGDIYFIPTSQSLLDNDFPILAEYDGCSCAFVSARDRFAVSGDTLDIFLGNLMNDYSENAEYNSIFDGTREIIPATVTLDEITTDSGESYMTDCSAKLIGLEINNNI